MKTIHNTVTATRLLLLVTFMLMVTGCGSMDPNFQLRKATRAGDSAKVQQLIAAGADVNYRGPLEKPPLLLRPPPGTMQPHWKYCSTMAHRLTTGLIPRDGHRFILPPPITVSPAPDCCWAEGQRSMRSIKMNIRRFILPYSPVTRRWPNC